MKLYQVAYYEYGKTVKAPGVSETALRECALYYAAESFEQVWNHIEDIRNDPEKELRAVSVAAESVQVLK